MKHRELSPKQQKTLAIVFISFAVALGITISIVVGIPLIKFLREPERFRMWVDSHGVWGKVAFVGIEVMKVIVVFIPGEPIELAAGYAFGVWQGMFLCLVGITIGSMIVFVLVHRYGMSIVRIFYSQEKIDTLRFLKASKRRDFLLTIIYILPGTPKDFLNYYAGLTGIRPFVWFWICSVGRIPSIITSTITGDAFVQKQYVFAIVFTVIVLLIGVAGVFFYNKILSHEDSKN